MNLVLIWQYFKLYKCTDKNIKHIIKEKKRSWQRIEKPWSWASTIKDAKVWKNKRRLQTLANHWQGLQLPKMQELILRRHVSNIRHTFSCGFGNRRAWGHPRTNVLKKKRSWRRLWYAIVCRWGGCGNLRADVAKGDLKLRKLQ